MMIIGLDIAGNFYDKERYTYGSNFCHITDRFAKVRVIEDITEIEEFRTSPVAFGDHQRLFTQRMNDEYEAFLEMIKEYVE